MTTNVKQNTIKKFLVNNVMASTELHTDEYKGYNQVKRLGYKHKRVNHSKRIYAIGDIHTNSIEGFWSQLKRSVHGTYHHVSKKYLQQYVNEFSFRYNLRRSEKPIFEHIIERVWNG